MDNRKPHAYAYAETTAKAVLEHYKTEVEKLYEGPEGEGGVRVC